jgi:CRISPR-associated protein Cmr1
MFGGGVEPGEPDPVTLIRSTAIRGHLRFWWRATRGAACADTKELKRREVEIFGDTENPSPVIVEVQAPKWEKRRLRDNDYGFVSRFGPEAYALFSAKQSEKDLCAEGFSFQLRIRWPKHAELQRRRRKENEQRRRQNQKLLPEKIEDITADVDTALSAWINFGGLGARTRRGCGALHSTDPRVLPAMEIIHHFPGARLLLGATSSELESWADAVEVYREFRQRQRSMKNRNDRSVPESRSFWPEPDAIRNLTGCHKPNHAPLPANTSFLDAFPRAELGMPIIFTFLKDGPGRDSQRRPNPPAADKDPCDAELVPQMRNEKGLWDEGTRMASPIITRPLCIDGKWRSAIIVFPLPKREDLRAFLRVRGIRDNKVVTIEEPITDRQIRDARLASLRPMRGKSSAIEAFIAFAQEPPHNFKEVTP